MKKILIANRGEIAVRIIRACQELGYRTVAVYSLADKDSLHAKIADESICIGPGPSSASYLSIPSLMSAAEVAGVDGIHPGYGFLSENHEFAEICQNYGINFIGPAVEHIRRLGNKVEARKLAEEADVPMFPGSKGVVADLEEAREVCKQIGFPLIIKAAAGGGGRGMKIVLKAEDLDKQYLLARSEAEAAFGNPDVFIERYCMRPRHVEIQIIGDKHGNLVHLGERDCSIQRRHQKLVEESPSPAVDSALRKKIGETALRLARTVNYHSVGTAEFLLDEDGSFYFMEVNTRIQVEHPVTELVTGVDLVQWQIRIAAGEHLSLNQEDISWKGAAIECRINAEDPDDAFKPSPGVISTFKVPDNSPAGPVRFDSHLDEGSRISSHYDSMIGKLIVYGKGRSDAMARMRRSLDEMQVGGVKTTLPLHKAILANAQFDKGQYDCRFLEDTLTWPR